MEKSIQPKQSLSARIIFRLIFPLFGLSVIFAALLVSNQIDYMNYFNKIESQTAFQALTQVIEDENRAGDAQALSFDRLKERSMALGKQYRFDQIQVLDLLDKQLLYGDSLVSWSGADFAAAEEALFLYKKQNKPFHIKVDRDHQVIAGYIPFQTGEDRHIYILRGTFPLANLFNALSKSKLNLVFILFFIALTGLVIARSLARSIVSPIRKLNEATQLIMQGQLGRHVEISTHDEIEMLAQTFNKMSDKLIEMKQRAEDSNPLTQLPGNQGIFHELQKRIHERQKFVLFHADLDRFKIFNDHFGLARGDEVIKKTAALLKHSVRTKGTFDDFVGHQGGDDFVIVTRPNHAKAIAEHVCHRFDLEILPALYRKDDLDRGYILELDRRKFNETGEEVLAKFPLMAISLAGVSTAKKDFADYFECMSAAAVIKKEVKKTVKSSYLIRE
ncbi:MAG: GGDEF domain-containing protein [Candidatus Omnitrophota bacterium]|jgi:diguanylate cyclase (GGDEF)-like protein